MSEYYYNQLVKAIYLINAKNLEYGSTHITLNNKDIIIEIIEKIIAAGNGFLLTSKFINFIVERAYYTAEHVYHLYNYNENINNIIIKDLNDLTSESTAIKTLSSFYNSQQDIEPYKSFYTLHYSECNKMFSEIKNTDNYFVFKKSFYVALVYTIYHYRSFWDSNYLRLIGYIKESYEIFISLMKINGITSIDSIEFITFVISFLDEENEKNNEAHK